MDRKRWIVAVIPLLCLAGCVRTTPAATGPTVAQLMPKVRVGMPDAGVQAALGNRFSGGGEPGRNMDYVYDAADGAVGIMVREGVVTHVVAMPKWTYANGNNPPEFRPRVRKGMALYEVWAAIGKAPRTESHSNGSSREEVLDYGSCRVHLENDVVVAID